MTVLWVLNADAVINVIKFWEHRYMCHRKIFYQKQLSKIVTAIFMRLGNQGFLRGVSNQNFNELFNKFLWSLFSKEQFNSPTSTSFPVLLSLAVCLYNFGLEYTLTSLMNNAELKFYTCLQSQQRSMDKDRMRNRIYAVRETCKEKSNLIKRSEIKRTITFKNHRVFSTNHKDFIQIPKTDSFSL